MSEKAHVSLSSVGQGPKGPILWISVDPVGPLPCPLSPREALDLARQLITIAANSLPVDES